MLTLIWMLHALTHEVYSLTLLWMLRHVYRATTGRSSCSGQRDTASPPSWLTTPTTRPRSVAVASVSSCPQCIWLCMCVCVYVYV